jgi:integrase/recombinase XerD
MSPAHRSRDRRVSLQFEDWPAADQASVEAAFAPGDVFDCGPLFHLRPSSQFTIRWSHGAWLAYVALEHPDRLRLLPSDRADRATLAAYARNLAARGCTRNTLDNMLRPIAWILGAAGDADIKERVRGLAALGTVRRDKAAEIVTSDMLIELGLRQMHAALDCSLSAKRGRAETYRDGLIIALLAATPLRRGNFAALRIGAGLLVGSDRILVCVDPEYTKSNRGGEWEVPTVLDSSVRV